MTPRALNRVKLYRLITRAFDEEHQFADFTLVAINAHSMMSNFFFSRLLL